MTAMAGAAIVGLQGADPSDLSGPDKVLATAKHWVGDGGTTYDPALAGSGYPIDQGITRVDSLDELRRLYVDPYVPAIEAGVGSIMPSYSAVSIAGADPVRMHENGALNTDLLKGELGFDGFLISDWEGIDKLPGGTYADKAARSVNAGLDMAMAPYNFGAFITAITGKVGVGRRHAGAGRRRGPPDPHAEVRARAVRRPVRGPRRRRPTSARPSTARWPARRRRSRRCC